jgi:hypothetical protein
MMFKVQPLSQMDPRWKEVKLGFDNQLTIGKYGCLLTSMPMVANGFGSNETPESMNNRMKAVNGFSGPLIIPALMPRVAPGLKFVKRIPCNNPPAPMYEIDASLAAGMPVIIKVDYSPEPGIQDHWVVLYGKEGDDYLIQDPWPNPAHTKKMRLTERYGFAGPPSSIIKDTLWYTGVQTQVVAGPPPPARSLPEDALEVFAAVDGLALRSQPIVADHTLLTRLSQWTKLYAYDPAEVARQKLGQVDVWLEVQVADSGRAGYCAAWYLALAPQASAPQPEATQPQPAVETPPDDQSSTQPLIVFATVDALALRSQPVISANTLLKRVSQNTEFRVLDPADKSKIGKQNQWMKVSDIQGTQGYVAAWFVAATRQDQPLGVIEESETPAPVPTASENVKLVVRAIEEGLALRRQPAITPDNLIKRQPLSAEMLVIEDATEAGNKIGVLNEWLNVKDIYGDEGYVAAWYVVKSPTPVYLQPTP